MYRQPILNSMYYIYFNLHYIIFHPQALFDACMSYYYSTTSFCVSGPTGRRESCGSHQFFCPVNHFCLSHSLRCDGKNDCPDRSDEFNCSKCVWLCACACACVRVCMRM